LLADAQKLRNAAFGRLAAGLGQWIGGCMDQSFFAELSAVACIAIAAELDLDLVADNKS
jgi:hypothetical protein